MEIVGEKNEGEKVCNKMVPGKIRGSENLETWINRAEMQQGGGKKRARVETRKNERGRRPERR